MVIFRTVQTWPEPNNPAKSLDGDPIPIQIEGLVGRRRVFVLKNWHRQVEWQVCFSKNRATRTRPELYKKSGQTY